MHTHKSLQIKTDQNDGYRHLFHNMPYGFVYCQISRDEEGYPDFIHLEVNASYERHTGLKNIVGLKVSEVFPEIRKSHPGFIERHLRVAETGVSDRFEFYLEPLQKWFDLSVYSSQKEYFSVIIDDITERKVTEQLLRKSEERFKTLFNSHSAIQALLDPDTGKVLDVNQEASEWYGWSVDELKQMYTRDINTMTPEAIISSLKSVPAEKQNKFVGKHRRADGSIRDVEIFRNKIELDGKAVIHVITHDITERRKAEEALKQSNERFKTLFEDHAAIKMVLDPETLNIINANRAAAIFYGWPVDELCRMNMQQIDMLSPAEVKAEMAKKQYGEKHNISFKHRMANGSVRNVEVFSNSIVIAGKPLLYSIIHDVTERIQAEREREKLQEQLQHSQKMEMVGQLAGGIAHDFNNMLTVIIGHTEMALLREGLPDAIFTDLEKIQKAATHSADLTRQLLSFARKQIVIPKLVELNVAVKEMLSLLKRLIGENITLQWVPKAQKSLLKIDPSQLDQILTNLIINARDAIVGIGKITITTSRQSLHNVTGLPAQSSDFNANYVTLTVTDTGCGIDKKNLPHIFEPFFTTKKGAKGTGLGLSTVYGIVKQNLGFIECNSTPGKGTSIKIQLPLHNTETAAVERPSLEPLIQHNQQTVLLVEDQSDILSMCKHMLEQQGFLVIPAGTPQEAILIAEKYKDSIDLLLTDVVMPEMNGSDLSNQLLLTCPNLKTLFMSGYTTDIIASHGVVEDGVNFIQKPFTSKKLIRSVDELLNHCMTRPKP
jgi:two-component system cell cycle sensor histidine kinase/response regulator CckA